MSETAQSMAAFAERVLDLLLRAKVDRQQMTFGSHGKLNPHYFSGAEPVMGPTVAGQDNYFVFSDATPGDLSRPLDIRLVGQNEDDDAGISLQRYRKVLPREVRGATRRLASEMVVGTYLLVDSDLRAMASRNIYGTGGTHGWEEIGNRTHPNGYLDELLARRMEMIYGLAFTQEYYWSVQLGWEGSPLIRFPTDPVGVRSVFRLRDLPEGRSRRAALRHWVSEHWRQARHDPAEERFVREHLRGAQTFTWNGLVCLVSPSDDDLRTLAASRDAREVMRAEGTDRRAREEPVAALPRSSPRLAGR